MQTEADRAVAARQRRASGGGRGSGGLSEERRGEESGAGKCQRSSGGQRKSCNGNVRPRKTKEQQTRVETGWTFC